jgi:hypothetical protein
MVGRYPDLSLAEGRAAARKALASITEGVSPRQLKLAKRQEAAERLRKADEKLFGPMAEQWITAYLKPPIYVAVQKRLHLCAGN